MYTQEKPNVLMLILDDLNNYVGAMQGHPQVETPNIDRLIKSGVLFNNAHSNVPVCAPSRASFMTGVSPITSGFWGFGDWTKNTILMNSKTIPEYFKDNGYVTYQTGKVFHKSKKGVWSEMGIPADYGPMAYNGKKAVQHPSNPQAMGVLGALDATFTPLSDIPHVAPTKDAPGYNGWYSTHWKNNKPFNYESENNRDLLTDEQSANWAVKKIEQLELDNNKSPFLLSVGFIRPHTPLVVPKKYYDLYPINNVQIPILKKNDKIDTKLGENTQKEPRGRIAFRTLTNGYSSKDLALRTYTQAYLASITFADEMVGKVLDALENSSFKDNTMVLLFSDHGYNLGQKDYLFKYALWEESTNVPLIISHPNFKQNFGLTVNAPVSLIDIYPTIKEFCQLKGSTLISDEGANLDGASLVPFLENPKTESWNGPDVALTIISSWTSNKPKDQHISVRSKDYRYILYANGAEELYDHQEDPHEWKNLSEDNSYKAIKSELKLKLQSML
tara:strand:+ start:33563 stop:35068 length:1506 start_codon:yes stop_codon:yes gene_type:complete